MTLETLRLEKAAIEREIFLLLRDFEHKFDISIDSVNTSRAITNDGRKTITIAATLELKL